MRRKPKVSPRRVVRRAATSATAAARRSFPAWIDASEHAVPFAAVVTPRVRDGLVLRVVTRSQPASRRGPHGAGAR